MSLSESVSQITEDKAARLDFDLGACAGAAERGVKLPAIDQPLVELDLDGVAVGRGLQHQKRCAATAAPFERQCGDRRGRRQRDTADLAAARAGYIAGAGDVVRA